MNTTAIIMFFTTNTVTFFCFIAMSFFVLLYRSKVKELKIEMKEKDRLIVQLNTSIEELKEEIQKRKVIATFGGG